MVELTRRSHVDDADADAIGIRSPNS